MTSKTLPSSDAGLLRLANLGDEAAFGELYNRYFQGVYDFLLRMTRNSEEAADLAQETFLRAMQNLTSLRQPDRFKSWLFSIAHNQAITRLERQGRIVPSASGDESDEMADPLLRQIDPDRLANPEQAADAQALSDLVWEAAQGLDRKQYALLDLVVRQELTSSEVAEVLGVSKGNAYTMINRMKQSVEGAIGAFLLARRGSKDCEQLQAILAPASFPPVTPALRKSIDRHVSKCDVCEETRKRILSPVEILGAFVPVPVPLGLQGDIWSALAAAWPEHGPAAAAAGNGPPGITAERLVQGLPSPGWGRWQLWAIAGMVGVAIFVPIVIATALFFNGSGGDEAPSVLVGGTPESEVAGEEATAGPTDTSTPTRTSTPRTATPTNTPTNTPTPQPANNPPANNPPPNNPPPNNPPPNNPPPNNPPPNNPPPDTVGPSIRNLRIDPADIWEEDSAVCPSSAHTTRVSAQVSDTSGVTSIRVGWSVGLTTGQTSMSRATTLAFATIGPFSPGTLGSSDTGTVNVIVQATDGRGNVSTANTSFTLHSCRIQ